MRFRLVLSHLLVFVLAAGLCACARQAVPSFCSSAALAPSGSSVAAPIDLSVYHSYFIMTGEDATDRSVLLTAEQQSSLQTSLTAGEWERVEDPAEAGFGTAATFSSDSGDTLYVTPNMLIVKDGTGATVGVYRTPAGAWAAVSNLTSEIEAADRASLSPLRGTTFSIGAGGAIENPSHTDFCYDCKDGVLRVAYDNRRNFISTGLSASAPANPFVAYPYLADTGVFLSVPKTAAAKRTGATLTILTSDDMAQSWRMAKVDVSGVVRYDGGFLPLGYTSADDGWLVLCDFVGSGQEMHYLYMTHDGGTSWQPVNGDYNAVYDRKLTGAGFIDARLGFLCFRCEDDFQPAVCRTKDGGISWEKLTIPLPEAYANYNAEPLAPFADDTGILLPVSLYDKTTGDPFSTIYLHSADGADSWELA